MPYGLLRMLEKRQDASLDNPIMVVSVVSWLLLVVMVLVVLTRVILKCVKSRGGRSLFGCDDSFVVAAALFSVGQTAAVSYECMHALGQHQSFATPQAMQEFFKAEYVSIIMFIANMGCARISVCLLIHKLLPGTIARRTALAMAMISIIWTMSAILVSAFACGMPQPWDVYNVKCINVYQFINYVSISNIILEASLIMIPIIIWNLRMSAGHCMLVSGAFLSRLLVIAAVAAQIPLFRQSAHGTDLPYSHWRTVLSCQVAQNLSVITACIPCLVPFILSVLSGETQTSRVNLSCKHSGRLTGIMGRKSTKYSSMSSASSTAQIQQRQPERYCAPLATYGLDRSSAHLHSQHFNRFPTPPAPSHLSSAPHEDVFMRSVEYPPSPSSGSPSVKDLSAVPKALSQVGVLPVSDWETESSERESGSQRSSRERRPDSDYVFKREKVISVPDTRDMTELEGWRKYPLPSSAEK